MKVAGISEFKAKLSEYLAAVEAGHEVLVTDHDRPVARVIRAGGRGAGRAEEDGRLDRLERAGVVRVGSGAIPDSFWSLSRPRDADSAILEALLDERSGGR